MEAKEQKDKKIEENERVAEGKNVWEEIGLDSRRYFKDSVDLDG